MMQKRKLGPYGPKVGAIGMGCWAIGGHFTLDGRNDGWGQVDDAQSVRAIELALDLGASLFDTADAYGTGHSEAILGSALKGRRDETFIATKFGYTYDERGKALVATDVSPSYIDWASAKSLKRLGTDCIDLYQIHVGDLSDDVADRAGEALEGLVEKGRIRAWGWSTDNAAAARRMLKYPHFAAVQQELSVLCDGPDMLALCAEAELASLNRSPLAMGMLSGKFSATSRLAKDDVRAAVTLGAVLRRWKAKAGNPRQGGRPTRPPDIRRPHRGAGRARLEPCPLAPHHPHPRLQDRGTGPRQSRRPGKGPLPATVMAEISGILNKEIEHV